MKIQNESLKGRKQSQSGPEKSIKKLIVMKRIKETKIKKQRGEV